MKYVNIPDTADCSVPFYLSVEEWVARHLPPDEYFFAWQVPPSVICGRHQDIPLEVDLSQAESLGVKVWRRKSGGGAVYADWNNVMFSYITPSAGVQTSFGSYTSKICAMLASLGLDAVPPGRNDIAINGHKVAGNAFYGMPGRSIVHGTMLYDADFATMSRVLTPSRAKVESKGVKSVPSRITTLRSEGLGMSCPDFIGHALKFLGDGGEVHLSHDDLTEVREIMMSYLNPRFLSPAPTAPKITTSEYIEGVGMVTFSCRISADGLIHRATLTGDFFPLADIDAKIVRHIEGIHPSDLPGVVEALDIPSVISGLTNEKLLNILTRNIP